MTVHPRRPGRRPWADLYYGWPLVVTLGITTTISYGTSYYLFGVLVVPLGRDLHWTRVSISGAYALATIVAGLLGVPIGRLVDRHGARVLMTVGSALGGFTLLSLATIQSPWQFYLLWAGGLGLANALTFYSVSFTVVANWFVLRRGRALAVLTLLGGMASPIFIPLAGALVARVGWRETLVVLAVVQLAVALPLHALVVRRQPEDLGLRPDGGILPDGSGSHSLSGLSARAALRVPAFWTLIGAYALANLATSVILVHGVAYLIGRGYGAVLAAGIVGAVGFASLPGRLGLNLLSDRLGAQPLLSLCLLMQGLGVVLFLHGDSVGWLIAFVVVYGAAFGAVLPLRAAVIADHFGRRAYGSITALQGVPGAVSAGIGPLGAGWLYDRLHGYTLPFALSACAFLLAGLSIALTPRRML